MKREITYQQLYDLEQNLEKVQREYPSLFFLFDKKINSFLQDTYVSRKAMHNNLKTLQQKYIVHNEKDQPQYAEGKFGEEWQYLESVIGKDGQLLTGEAIKQAYEAEFMEFMKRSVTVTV